MRDLRSIDTSTLWHPFTQMAAYAEEDAPIIERGEGAWLIDTEGKRYLDGVSSLWCNVHGHRHPVIDAAIRDQLDRIAHSTLLGLGSVPSIRLADELTQLTGMDHIFYADSGSAAVEIAMKVVFQHMRRTRGESRRMFLSFRNAYHGDTLGAVSVGGIDLFHGIFRPLLFETVFAPSPYTYRWPGRDCFAESLAEFERLLAHHENELCGVILEPMVQGAAGMIVQPPEFVREVRRMTAARGIPLIADEVATGFGRTGKMFACEGEGVRPDALVLGKGISAGYLPLSAALFTEEIYASFLGRHEDAVHFLHGHTYTGNALACAAGLASLDVFRAEGTIKGLPEKIALIARELASLRDHPHVGEVRQCGMMVGIELVCDRETKASFDAAKRMGHRVILEARARGLILRPLGDVIVLMPPLSISRDELMEIVRITKESIVQSTKS